MRASWMVIAAALVFGPGCGGEDNADQSVSFVSCDSPEGSWNNLESETESGWDRTAPQDRIDWTDEVGCAINLNYVFHRLGDEHCDTQAAQFISIGLPIGIPYTGIGAADPAQNWEPLFFHNGDSVFDRFDPGQVLTELPADAIDTGLRSGARSLWSTESENMLFVDDGTEVLVFVPVADEDVSCA